MKTIKILDKITDVITRIFAYVAGLSLLFIVVIIIANIIGRAAGKAIIGVEEYFSMAEVVLIALALGFTQYQRGLVHVGFFIKKLPETGTLIVWALNQWIGTAVVGVWLWQAIVRVPNVKQATTALLIPYKPFYAVVAVGCAVYLVAQLYEAIKSTAALFNREVRQEVLDNLPA
ncbi:MAG: TRAP transporter small permease [Oscillospiraceae bacterium]